MLGAASENCVVSTSATQRPKRGLVVLLRRIPYSDPDEIGSRRCPLGLARWMRVASAIPATMGRHRHLHRVAFAGRLEGQ